MNRQSKNFDTYVSKFFAYMQKFLAIRSWKTNWPTLLLSLNRRLKERRCCIKTRNSKEFCKNSKELYKISIILCLMPSFWHTFC